MTDNTLTITYPDELLLSLKKSPGEFEAEAKLLLAVKLYELHQVSSGMAAQLAGMSRTAFLLELGRFGISPFGQESDELAEDYNNVEAFG